MGISLRERREGEKDSFRKKCVQVSFHSDPNSIIKLILLFKLGILNVFQ